MLKQFKSLALTGLFALATAGAFAAAPDEPRVLDFEALEKVNLPIIFPHSVLRFACSYLLASSSQKSQLFMCNSDDAYTTKLLHKISLLPIA